MVDFVNDGVGELYNDNADDAANNVEENGIQSTSLIKR